MRLRVADNSRCAITGLLMSLSGPRLWVSTVACTCCAGEQLTSCLTCRCAICGVDVVFEPLDGVPWLWLTVRTGGAGAVWKRVTELPRFFDEFSFWRRGLSLRGLPLLRSESFLAEVDLMVVDSVLFASALLE